jgi:hypothetical protein
MSYKVLFIDEQKEAHRDFMTKFIKQNQERFFGVYEYPKGTLQEMMDVINEIKPDAILTDFALNVHKSEHVPDQIEYDGNDLAEEIKLHKFNFPTFITTSLSGDAATQGADALIVFDKSHFGDKADANHNEKELTLADRIFFSISRYKQQLEDWSKEFDSLIDIKGSRPLTESEEARLIELDNYLESSLDKQSMLPATLKQTSSLQKLEEIISQTKRILGQV